MLKQCLIISTQDQQSEIEIDIDSDRLLGKGHSGSVFFGTHKVTNTPLAIKCIYVDNKDIHSKNKHLKCMAEIDVAKRLSSENPSNVVLLHGHAKKCVAPFEDIAVYVLAFNYAERGGLDKCITKQQLQDSQKIPIMHGIAKGINYIHGKEILHGDLKTSNIVLDASFTPLVCDFEMSKSIHEENWFMGGTKIYQAPEIQKNWSYNTRESDMYSFGLICWCIIVGLPHPFLNNINVPIESVTGRRKPLTIPDSCPARIRDLISKTWSLSPDSRYTASQTVSILRTSLMLKELDEIEGKFQKIKSTCHYDDNRYSLRQLFTNDEGYTEDQLNEIEVLKINYLNKLKEFYHEKPMIKEDLLLHIKQSELVSFNTTRYKLLMFMNKDSTYVKAFNILFNTNAQAEVAFKEYGLNF